MRWVLFSVLLLPLAACTPAPPPPPGSTYTQAEIEQRLDRNTAEGTLRALVVGMQVDDAPLLQQLAGPLEKPDVLLLQSNERPTLSEEIQLRQGAALQIRHLQAGDLVRDEAGQERPILAEELSATSMWLTIETIPTPLRVQKLDGRWHVDVRPLLALRRGEGSGDRVGRGSRVPQ